jgi:hypothetical protein
VTGESTKETEPWIEKHGVRYPYAYDKGEKLFSKLRLEGYPSAVIVDTKGIVRWVGHPQEITDAMIEEHLAKTGLAIDVQVLCKQLPDSAKTVKEALQKGLLGKALAASRQLATAGADAPWLDELEALVKQRLDKIAAKRGEGDYLGAIDAAKELEKQLAGAPQSQEAAALAKAIQSDKSASPVLAAQKQLQSIAERIAKARKAKDLQGLVSNLEQIRRKHKGTYAETTATELISMAERRVSELR